MSDLSSTGDFSALSESSEDDLLFRLGSGLDAHDFGAGRAARGDIIRRARHWLTEELPLMAERVCADPRVVAFRSKKTSDRHELFVVLCDIVGSMHGGLPVATIAMLILRMGLKTLCGEIPTDKSL